MQKSGLGVLKWRRHPTVGCESLGILSFRDGLSCSGERVVDREMVGAEGWIGFHWGENMKRS